MRAAVAVTLLLGASPSLAAEAICGDQAVIYCNDFEAGLDGIEADPDATIAGGQLQADFDTDGDGCGWGYRFAGEPQVYARFYVKFDATWTRPMHHFYAIHGDATDNMWSCHGDAGCRPNGVICLSGTTVDHREGPAGELPGEPFFYTYYPDMTCDPGSTCANYADPDQICADCATRGLPCESGPECCWGNSFDVNQGADAIMQADRWYAMETMVLANTPGTPDGEMALWIDGTLVAHHTGLLWRETPDLLLDHLIIWDYFPEATELHQAWFDDLVISRQPIGLRDMPTPTPDAGSGGGGADAAGGTPATGDSGGCGCRVTTRGGSGSLLILMLFATAAARKSRRQR